MDVFSILRPQTPPEQPQVFTPKTVGGVAPWHLLVRQGALKYWFPNVAVAAAAAVTPELRAQGVRDSLAYSGFENNPVGPLVVCGLTAVWIWCGGDPPSQISLAYQQGRARPYLRNVLFKSHNYSSRETVELSGMPVTVKNRTICDLALWLEPALAFDAIGRIAANGGDLSEASRILERHQRILGRPQARDILDTAKATLGRRGSDQGWIKHSSGDGDDVPIFSAPPQLSGELQTRLERGEVQQ